MALRRKIIRIIRIGNKHHYKVFGITFKRFSNFSRFLKLKDNEYKLKKNANKLKVKTKKLHNENKELKNKNNIIQTNLLALEKTNQDLNEAFQRELTKYSDYENRSISFENVLEINQIIQHKKNSKQFMEMYLDNEFEDKFERMTQNLTLKDKKKYKFLFSRMLAIYFMNKSSIFNKKEKIMQENQEVFKENMIDGNNICGFKIENGYDIHSFFNDMGLTQKDKEFLKNKNMIDIGAFTGDTALLLSKYTNKKIYAFEPFIDNFMAMENNIKSNNVKNIVPIHKGISNNEKTANIFMYKDYTGALAINPENATFPDKEYNAISEVDITTIDSFVEENNLNDIGLIKIDIEGLEQKAIEGSLETIKKFRPILLISIYHNASDFLEVKPIIENLNLNYEFSIDKERPESVIGETMLYCRPLH